MVFLLKKFPQWIVPIKMLIQEVWEVFTYVNVGKFTEWRVKPDYSSISIFSSSILLVL